MESKVHHKYNLNSSPCKLITEDRLGCDCDMSISGRTYPFDVRDVPLCLTLYVSSKNELHMCLEILMVCLSNALICCANRRTQRSFFYGDCHTNNMHGIRSVSNSILCNVGIYTSTWLLSMLNRLNTS